MGTLNIVVQISDKQRTNYRHQLPRPRQVTVRDENDNPPQFSQRSYYTTVRENGTKGAVVTTLTVNDADEGRNAEVIYRVAGAHRDSFRILDNGTMIATVPLDREVRWPLLGVTRFRVWLRLLYMGVEPNCSLHCVFCCCCCCCLFVFFWGGAGGELHETDIYMGGE